MTVFRDRDAAARERVRSSIERLAEDLAAIDPLVLAHADDWRSSVIASAKALVESAPELEALRAGALAEREHQVEALLEPIAEERRRSPERRTELLSSDHPFTVPAPRTFTPPVYTQGLSLGVPGMTSLDREVARALPWAEELTTAWLVDPRKERRGIFGLLLGGERWAAVGARFRFAGAPFHLTCETRPQGADSTHFLVMSTAVPRALGSVTLRFLPEMEPHLSTTLAKPLAALARYDVPNCQIEDGSAHVYLGFEVDPRLLALMRTFLLALRGLPPTEPLRDMVLEACRLGLRG